MRRSCQMKAGRRCSPTPPPPGAALTWRYGNESRAFAVHSLQTLQEWGERHNPDRKQDVQGRVTEYPPVRQPLVRTHRATGAKSLYICPAVISHIEGLDPADSSALIKHAT